MPSVPSILAVLVGLTSVAGAVPVRFDVRVDPEVAAGPMDGRLVVYLIRSGSGLRRSATPASGPFFSNPQPMYGVDVRGLDAGVLVTVGDEATSFPVPPSELPPGRYRAQAVLDRVRADSKWSREPGNLSSDPAAFEIPEAGEPVRVELVLANVVERDPGAPFARMDRVQRVVVRSALLSEFHGREMTLAAGVVLPEGHDPARRWPAIYEVPGFGGTVLDALRARRMSGRRGGADDVLDRHVVRIVLDPESGNGHHLFANSANNGPVGDALVTELLPVLEERFGLVPEASARLLRGHSSGGWSVVWLTLAYPVTFGGAWSTAPDPVDFRAFQRTDIYEADNMYVAGARAIASYVTGGRVRMTVRDENRMEEVLGEHNTSAQQWDSWFAVFGPRDDRGHPAALFDPITGAIDHQIAERYRAYDIGALLRAEPQRIGALLRQRVRLVCGSDDDFALHRAVERLRHDLEGMADLPDGPGFVTMVPGAGHGSVLASEAVRDFPRQMLVALRRAGHVPHEAAP